MHSDTRTDTDMVTYMSTHVDTHLRKRSTRTAHTRTHAHTHTRTHAHTHTRTHARIQHTHSIHNMPTTHITYITCLRNAYNTPDTGQSYDTNMRRSRRNASALSFPRFLLKTLVLVCKMIHRQTDRQTDRHTNNTRVLVTSGDDGFFERAGCVGISPSSVHTWFHLHVAYILL